MSFRLLELDVDPYFLLLNFLYVAARRHDWATKRDMLPYIVKTTDDPNMFVIMRQALEVATVVVKNMSCTIEYRDTTWGKQFNNWIEEGTRC